MRKILMLSSLFVVLLAFAGNAQWSNSITMPDMNTWSAQSGLIGWYGGANGPLGQGYGSGVQFSLPGDTRYGAQVVVPSFYNALFFRTRTPGAWSGWYQVWSSNNLNRSDTDFACKNLRANGNLWAKEIKVAVANPWPDYVFYSSYQLPELSELAEHIKKKGHLPGMPSANEVKANGINLAEMNAKLLEKVEELTLYLIEQEKQTFAQKSKMDDLGSALIEKEKEEGELEARLEKLEQLLITHK